MDRSTLKEARRAGVTDMGHRDQSRYVNGTTKIELRDVRDAHRLQSKYDFSIVPKRFFRVREALQLPHRRLT
jgi:hypothetical protein